VILRANLIADKYRFPWNFYSL